MAIQTSSTFELGAAQKRVSIAGSIFQAIWSAVKVLVGIALAVIVVLILGQLVESAPSLFGSSTIVDESLTQSITRLLIYIAPFAAYGVCSRTARNHAPRRRQIVVALATAAIIYALVSIGQVVLEIGPYAEKPSFGLLEQRSKTARVESLDERSGVKRVSAM
jgi:hypothetical protein